MDMEQKYAFAAAKLTGFKNYIEIGDFRKFVLLILNLEGGGPEAILKQLGMGGKGKTVLPYDPQKNAYYTKIMAGLSVSHQMVVYHKTPKVHTTFVNKADSAIFTKTLTVFERQNLLPNKFTVICPDITDTMIKVQDGDNVPKPTISGVESIFTSLAEMIATQDLKFIFSIEGKGKEPDLAFSMSMGIEMQEKSPNQIQYFDIFVDEKKQLRGHTFIKMADKEDDSALEMQFIDEIKDFGHTELFNSHFCIIVPVKSFDAL